MSDYFTALAAVGIKALILEDIGDYQGSYVAAVYDEGTYTWGYEDDDQIGFLVVGYGSCSGCDEWQAAESAESRVETLDRVVKSIKWFPNLAEFKAFIAGAPAEVEYDEDGREAWDRFSNDHALQWYGHEGKWKTFVDRVAEFTA